MLNFQERIIETSTAISVIATLIATLSALYARWSAKEAKKANNIGRLNALLSFRQHYLESIQHQEKMVETLGGIPSGMQSIHETHAKLDTKLREVLSELEKYHNKVINDEI